MENPRDYTTKANTSLPIFRKNRQGNALLIGFEGQTEQFISALLESQGYAVTLANGASEALSYIQGNHFSFIIFDWFLQGAAGSDLCQIIRKVNKKMPVFFYARQSIEKSIQLAIEASAKKYRVQSVATNPLLETLFLHMEKRDVEVAAGTEITKAIA